jgi:3-oxoacyl-[acyl-carrier protein] reductase
MNKKIVITGASSDIGSAIAQRIVSPDDHVILQCNKNKSACEKLANGLKASCRIEQVDFSDNSKLEIFCNELKNTDILINAAAVTKTDLLPHLNDHAIDTMIQVNISAAIKTCRAVIPSMLPKRKGIIINISSVAAARGNRGQTVYGGTKGFIESFTRSLAAEFGPKGIRANCISPGPMEAGSLNELMAYGSDEVKKSVTVPRLGTPEDVAHMAAYLCRDEASFINGSILPVNGGFIRGV